ncbi:uncharacterized protein LOC124929397 [Impatiens glandulifera]|uniref:uncharacterized protein LOC124929397 n=1 Tax=Impatiens glandulifera TaxID=253017 RepID=UPI001FB1917A|nr:uncharacterized protein LOC124929397 [Impatiens glandulifera]
MPGNGDGGNFYWVRNQQSPENLKGIVVVFSWISVHETILRTYTDLYSSLGWISLVSHSDFLNPFFPDRSTSLAFNLLNELAEELKIRPCPLVLVALSGGSKACMYKFLQILEGGVGNVQLELVRDSISGQIYDSAPVDFARDLGARFILHPNIFKVPGSNKLMSLFAKAVTFGADALFFTRSGYWKTIYSSVNLECPFLVLCSETDEFAPYPVIINFVKQIEILGGNVKLVKFNDSPHIGHYNNYPIQYRSAVSDLLEQAVSIYCNKNPGFGERSCNHMKEMKDEISGLISDLQNATIDLKKEEECVHLWSPPKMNAHTLLGEILFDACVPKNVEGWDIKFVSGCNKRSSSSPTKRVRSRL